MYLFITFTCLLLSLASSQHYNYPRPKAPFPLVSRGQVNGHHQAPRAIDSPAQSFVVRTVGPNRHAYEVQMLKSQQLYEGRVSSTVQSNHLNYAPGPPPPQQQYHHQHQQQLQQHYQQQSSPYSVNTNPLIQGGPISYALPASAPAPAEITYGPPNYTPPAPISYSSPVAAQLSPPPLPVSYGPPDSPPPPPASAPIAAGPPASQPPTSAHPNSPQHNAAGNQLIPIPPINPEPYAVVQLPNGAQVQDGGHGAGGHQQNGAGSRTGDYHAQSQASQLDYYNYKQNPTGDARDYQRYITTCSPDGQCQRVAVNPGQAEPGHQQFIIDARAHTAPSQDICKRFVKARAAQDAASGGGSFRRSSSGGGSGSGGGGGGGGDSAAVGSSLLGGQRPPNRRYFQYTETVLARDPYN